MFLAIVDDDTHIAEGEARHNTSLQSGMDTFFNGRQVGFRKVHPYQFIGKLKITLRAGFDPQPDFAELARTAGLLLMAVHGVGFLGDAFTVGYLRLGGGKPHLELAFGAPDGHIDMLITHALQDGLTGGRFLIP